MFIEDFIEVTMSRTGDDKAENKKILIAVKYIKTVFPRLDGAKGSAIILDGKGDIRIECDEDYETVREKIALVKLLPYIGGEKHGTEKG